MLQRKLTTQGRNQQLAWIAILLVGFHPLVAATRNDAPMQSFCSSQLGMAEARLPGCGRDTKTDKRVTWLAGYCTGVAAQRAGGGLSAQEGVRTACPAVLAARCTYPADSPVAPGELDNTVCCHEGNDLQGNTAVEPSLWSFKTCRHRAVCARMQRCVLTSASGPLRYTLKAVPDAVFPAYCCARAMATGTTRHWRLGRA